MKILRAAFSLDPKDGGVTEAIRSSTLALQRLGHTVDVVTLDEPDAPFLEHFPSTTHPMGRWVERYGYTPKLRHWITENGGGYDVGIIEGLWNHASIGGHQGMRAADLPYIVFPHGMMDPWFRLRYPTKHTVKQLFWWVLQGRVLGDAAVVAFTCEEEKRLARGVFSGPTYRETVVSLGIAHPPDAHPHAIERMSLLLPALAGKPYFLFMSRIHPKKGCDLLIRAFAELAKEDEVMQLVVAGPDQSGWKVELQALARSLGVEKRIHWPGMLEGEIKWDAIYASEAFVLPSHQENFGIVVAEAMACGKPVLTTNKVNIWREVEASGGGIIEHDNQQGIMRLLRNWRSMTSEEKKIMASKARAGFSAHFHIESAAHDLEQLLHNVKRKGPA